MRFKITNMADTTIEVEAENWGAVVFEYYTDMGTDFPDVFDFHICTIEDITEY